MGAQHPPHPWTVVTEGFAPMFSKDLEHSIGQCYKRAREARHEFMTVEHLLLALLDNPSAESVLKATCADFARLRRELEEAIEVSVNKLADDDGRDVRTNQGAGWRWRQPVQAGRGLLRGFRNAHGSSVSNPRCDFVGPAVALLDRSSGVGGVLRKM